MRIATALLATSAIFAASCELLPSQRPSSARHDRGDRRAADRAHRERRAAAAKVRADEPDEGPVLQSVHAQWIVDDSQVRAELMLFGTNLAERPYVTSLSPAITIVRIEPDRARTSVIVALDPRAPAGDYDLQYEAPNRPPIPYTIHYEGMKASEAAARAASAEPAAASAEASAYDSAATAAAEETSTTDDLVPAAPDADDSPHDSYDSDDSSDDDSTPSDDE